MKKILFITTLALVSSFPSLQAQKTVKITYERNSAKEYVFINENTNIAPYSVRILFEKLYNLQGSPSVGFPYLKVVENGKHELFKLKPVDVGSASDFSYRYSSVKGNYHSKVDTNFVYLLPVGINKKTSPNRTTTLDNLFDKTKKQKVVGLAFNMEDGDTVYASRSGIVTDMLDNSASSTDHKVYAASENYVELLQRDGSFAKYKLFRDKGIFVEEGDFVYAGQPLGIIGGSNYANGSHLRMIVSYLREAENKDYNKTFEYENFIPVFHLAAGKDDKPGFREEYVSEHPQEYIIIDLTKSQRKKYLKSK